MARGKKSKSATCGCKHHLAFHMAKMGGGFGKCNWELYDGSTKRTRYCGCTHYVGPIPVDEFTL
jgi:hypothetical protein